MKISKQEQIFIIIFIVAAIVGVGFFVFVLPNFNNIEVNNKNLTNTKNQYTELENKLKDREPKINGEIDAAYEEGKNLADSFYNDLTTYEADEIMRQFLAKATDVKIDGLSIAPFATSTLSISVFKPTEVTYPLKDFANTVVQEEEELVDITKLTPREKIMYLKSINAALLSIEQPVTVGSIEVAFTAKSDKLENLHELVDILNEGIYDENIKDKDGNPQRKATYMKSVEFEMPYKSGVEENKDSNTSTDNDQNTQGGNNNNNSDVEMEYGMNFTVSFLCIKPVANPNLSGTEAAQ